MIVAKRQSSKKQHSIDETSKAKFPSARYFQVHFQHMEAQLDLTNRRLDALQQLLAELQAQLGAGYDEPNASK